MNQRITIKDIIPLDILLKIKYHQGFKSTKCLNVDTQTKRIFYLDAPNYSNLGDQAIALAINEISNKFFNNYEFIEITLEDYPSYFNWLKQNINFNDLIFLSGGGNMGNVYKLFEAIRRHIIKNFPNNRIIIFPQTIDYSNNILGYISQRKSSIIYNKHKNLYLSAREQKSYKKMKHLYSKNNVFYLPDVVLSLSIQGLEHNTSKTEIGVCLREDIESVLSKKERNKIKFYLNETIGKVKEISTVTDVYPINYKNREMLLKEKMDEISNCKLMVTDRLHAMIFSYITKTPCVFFDNSNKKLSGVYQWINKCTSIVRVNDYNSFVEATNLLLNKQNSFDSCDEINKIYFDFSALINRIGG